jgi:hypothetical protein
MERAAPLLVQDSDDRKTYVIHPRQIQLSQLQDMMTQFRAIFWPTTAVKLDIMASLRFAQVVVQHAKTLFRETLWDEPVPAAGPVSLASGFDVTFYKFLGSAHTTMNISTIGLPVWLPSLESQEQVEAADLLLSEHVQLIRQLRNSKGEEEAEEYQLLHLYRDFLSGNDLHVFWKFTTAYSGYLMSAQAHEKQTRRYIRPLSYKGLESLLMNNKDKNAEAIEILSDPGFQHIADAIRRSTIFAQWRRAQFEDRTYEVRHGLDQDLMRKARYGKEFTLALSEFLLLYNAETAMEDEKIVREIMHEEKRDHPRPLTPADRTKHNLRYMTNEDDFNRVMLLTNRYGSELVGSMLVACGYSLKGTAQETQQATQTSEEHLREA